MIEVYANDVLTQLAAPIAPSATSLAVSAGTGTLFPAPAAGQFGRFTIRDAATMLLNEIMFYTAVSGDVLTVQRGQEGTAPQNWTAGDIIDMGPTAGAMAQLVQVGQLQGGGFLFAADTGSANAYAATLTPAIDALTDGMQVSLRIAHTNTGASTLNLNAIGATTIVGLGAAALQGGELLATGLAILQYDATAAHWALLGCEGGALQVGAATQSQHAMQLGQAVGRLIGCQVFNTSGTHAYTATPGTKSQVIEGCGGGGAGGGAPGGSGVCAGGGGQSGAWGTAVLLATAVLSATITVGAPGAAIINASGGNGTVSSFGSTATFPGGEGGHVALLRPTPEISGAGGSAGTSPTGTAWGSPGTPGTSGFSLGTLANMTGAGGSTPYGSGGLSFGDTAAAANNGKAATGSGAGGGGASSVNGGTAAGGAGGTGLVIVWEYS